MSDKLGHDPELCKMLIPKWEVGCRRITPGPGYLESLTQGNCHLTNSPITHVSQTAVHTADGKVHEVDVGKYLSTSTEHFKADNISQSSAQPASTSLTALAIPS